MLPSRRLAGAAFAKFFPRPEEDRLDRTFRDAELPADLGAGEVRALAQDQCLGAAIGYGA